MNGLTIDKTKPTPQKRLTSTKVTAGKQSSPHVITEEKNPILSLLKKKLSMDVESMMNKKQQSPQQQNNQSSKLLTIPERVKENKFQKTSPKDKG